MGNQKKRVVLVTGATGFVGANLTRRLVREGYVVHILTRSTSNKWRIEDIMPALCNHTVDLREEKKLKRIISKISPRAIFHLATAGSHEWKQLPEKKLIETNFLGTLNLIHACDGIEYDCFVNTGSSSEYGPKAGPMRETDIAEPVNTYGITKLAATLYGQIAAKTKHKPIIGFRIFSPFGPYDDNNRLVAYAITKALKNQPLNLANPDAVRDFIYIEDILDFYLRSISQAKNFKGEVFNVGSGHQIRISHIVEKIIRLAGSKSKIKWHTFSGRSYDTKSWQADIGKSARLFNWSCRHSLEEGIKKTILWFNDNLPLYRER